MIYEPCSVYWCVWPGKIKKINAMCEENMLNSFSMFSLLHTHGVGGDMGAVNNFRVELV